MARKALLIGSNSYGSGIDSLLVPKDDIEALSSLLENKDIARFEVAKCYEEGLQETQTAISSLFSQNANTDDLLLLYFAGHGIRDQNGGLRLALRDTNTDALEATTISASFVNSLISRCPSRRKVVILDCCHAAALLNSTTESEFTTILSRKGPVDQAFIKSNFFQNEGGHADGTGTYILAASQSGQSAFEVVRNGKAVSAYTSLIIDGIRTGEAAPEKPDISVKDLHNYVRKNRSSLSVETDPVMSVFHAGDDIVLCVNPVEPIPLSMLDALNSDDRFARIGAVEALHEIMKNESQPSRKKLILEHWRRKLEEGDQQERDFEIREKIEKLVKFYDRVGPGHPPTWGQILKDFIDTLGSAFSRVLRGIVYAAISIGVLVYGWNVQKHYNDTLALGAEIDWDFRTTLRLFALQDISVAIKVEPEEEQLIPLSTLPVAMPDEEFTTLIGQLDSPTTAVRRAARDALGDGDPSVSWRLLDELSEADNTYSKDLGILFALDKVFSANSSLGTMVSRQLQDEHIEAIARVKSITDPTIRTNVTAVIGHLGLNDFLSMDQLIEKRQERVSAGELYLENHLNALTVEDFAATYDNISSARILDRVYLSHTVNPNAKTLENRDPEGVLRQLHQFQTTQYGWSDIGAHFYVFPDGEIIPGRSLDEKPTVRELSGSVVRGPVFIELVLNGDEESVSDKQSRALVAVLRALNLSFGLKLEQDVFEEGGFHRNLFVGRSGPGSNVTGQDIEQWYYSLKDSIYFPSTQPGEWFVRGAKLRQTTLGALGNLEDCANEFRKAVEAKTGDSVSTQLWETDTHFLFTVGDGMTRDEAQEFQEAAGQIGCSGQTVLDSRSNFAHVGENADLTGFRVFIHVSASEIESSVEERMRRFFESRGATVAFDDKQDEFGPGVDYRRGDRGAQLTAELIAWVLNNRDGIQEHFTDIAPRAQSTISDGMTLGIWLQPSG